VSVWIRRMWKVVRLWIVIRELKREAGRKHNCKAEDFQLDEGPSWRCRRCSRRLGEP
jgi:hypothetical protein